MKQGIIKLGLVLGLFIPLVSQANNACEADAMRIYSAIYDGVKKDFNQWNPDKINFYDSVDAQMAQYMTSLEDENLPCEPKCNNYLLAFNLGDLSPNSSK